MGLYENGTVFNVQFNTWNDFKAVVHYPAHLEANWNRLASVDCIIRGIDYAINHLYIYFWPTI
jgi:hypothetical protein